MPRLFVEVLLPVLAVAGLGWLLASRLTIDPRSLNRVVFHLFVPCLVFRLLVESRLDGDAVVRMAAFTVAALAIPAAIAWATCRLLRWPRERCAAVVLVTLLPNAGNLGLPVVRFAFGDEGLAHAGVFFVASSVVTYTAGVFVASVGRASVGASLARLPRIPAIWAVVVAAVVIASGRSVPGVWMRTVDLVADATIPTFLVVLGMQLHAGAVRSAAAPVALAASIRLLLGAAAGFTLAPLIGLSETAARAAITEAAMPSAVATTVLATEYDLEPRFVTSVVVVTTLLSPLTLTVVLAWLGA